IYGPAALAAAERTSGLASPRAAPARTCDAILPSQFQGADVMAELPTKTLGRTGLQVTALGYGAMELRGAPRGREITPETAQSVLNAVLDGGVTFIDTSIDYGQSEELIGRFIAGRRSEYVLATKCGCLVDAAPAPPGERNPHIFTRENIVAGVNQS